MLNVKTGAMLCCMMFGSMAASAALTVTMVDPTPGNIFDPTLYTDGVQISCSREILTCDKTVLTYTTTDGSEKSVDVTDFEFNPFALYLHITNSYKQAVAEAVPGSDINVTVYNLRNMSGEVVGATEVENTTVEDGNLSFIFKSIPSMELVNVTWPEEFYLTWQPGSAAGIATFEFNSDVASVQSAGVQLGFQELTGEGGGTDDPDGYCEIIPEIEGNIVILDFTSVDLQLLPNFDSYAYVTLSLEGVTNTDGMQSRFHFNYTDLKGREQDVWAAILLHYLPLIKEAEPRNPAGIEALPKAEGYKVYNLQGYKVLDTDNAAALRELAPGIYIVNGMKVRI